MLISRTFLNYYKHNIRNTTKYARLFPSPSRLYSNKSKTYDDESEDAPIKYSTSPASQWKAQHSRSGAVIDKLWYEPEESDIDQELIGTLYDRVEGLEEAQLQTALKYNKEHQLNADSIIKRLEELEQEKQTSKEVE